MEAHESSSSISTLSDSQDTTIAEELNEFTHLPFYNAAESDDAADSTSESVEQNCRVSFIQQPHPRVKETDGTVIFSPDLYGPISERCVSEAPSLSTADSSEEYSFLRERTGLRGLYDKYSTWMRILRSCGLLLPFEIICLAFTIACCFMGAYNWPLCPANIYIPRYVFFNGAIATFSVGVEVMNSLFKLFLDRYRENRIYFCAFGLGWIALITTLIEMAEFYTMSYSFQRNEEIYCNEAFYWFVYYKNIAFGVLVSLVAMIYVPSYRHYSFFMDF